MSVKRKVTVPVGRLFKNGLPLYHGGANKQRRRSPVMGLLPWRSAPATHQTARRRPSAAVCRRTCTTHSQRAFRRGNLFPSEGQSYSKSTDGNVTAPESTKVQPLASGKHAVTSVTLIPLLAKATLNDPSRGPVPSPNPFLLQADPDIGHGLAARRRPHARASLEGHRSRAGDPGRR